MIKSLIALCVVMGLIGCATTTPSVQVVYVDKPIPFVPKPPDVPTFISEVDKLSQSDSADYGKVGRAYKYDMTFLRQQALIYQLILDQYRSASQNFDAVKQQIDKLIESIPK